MTAYSDFENSIASAKQLTKMYTELRGYRKLGPRGRLPPNNEDLLWLPRSAVVASISSLDAYVHAVLRDRIPHVLQSDKIPDALSEAMANCLPIKSKENFLKALPLISSGNIYQKLAAKFDDEVLLFSSYQAPEKIINAYELLGYPKVFELVSALWSGPKRADKDIKGLLANYVKRRNQIAHEGDREASGTVRHMQPAYANDCSEFVRNLVSKLNQTVFGN